jgi:hypothetical protein
VFASFTREKTSVRLKVPDEVGSFHKCGEELRQLARLMFLE